MTRQEINRFFRVLGKESSEPARVIVTGAAAGALWGGKRLSLDIDFAVEPVKANPASWDRVEKAISRAKAVTGIDVNYAQDIDRWGMISLTDYRRHTRLYRRFGPVEVRLLEVAYWSIGKMSRYLDSDVQDMVTVFQKQDVPPGRFIAVWAKALRNSPRSPGQFDFRRHVEHFIETYGRRVWGRQADPEKLTASFHKQAGIRRQQATA